MSQSDPAPGRRAKLKSWLGKRKGTQNRYKGNNTTFLPDKQKELFYGLFRCIPG